MLFSNRQVQVQAEGEYLQGKYQQSEEVCVWPLCHACLASLESYPKVLLYAVARARTLSLCHGAFETKLELSLMMCVSCGFATVGE
mmetsp:Transcript_14389/g.21300  ORF Transcript_14389/g.21300 Transcript_14389/m.21300 type:complete len:86 (-) Transcript_14389:87-344(-)